MKIHLKTDQSRKIIQHPCRDLVAVWCLKILLNLQGWRNLSTFAYTCDGELLRTIGLEHLENEEITKEGFVSALEQAQANYIGNTVKLRGTSKKNIKALKELIGLNKNETTILLFVILLKTHSALDCVVDSLEHLTSDNIMEALAVLLDMPKTAVQKALANRSLLAKSGILRLVRGKSDRFQNKLELMEGLSDIIFESKVNMEEALAKYFRRAQPAQLNEADYEHVLSDFQLIKNYLAQGQHQSKKGINILVYGQPGTGKSELAKTLADDLGYLLYEVSTSDNEGEALSGKSRFSAYQLSQQVLSQQPNTLILFDEIEDVMPESGGLFNSTPVEEKRKAWINQQLEENPVPAIWISNKISQIDPAFIRRFDFVFKLDTPPRKVREEILHKYLHGLPVSTSWIKATAENQNLAPALISRAAKVAAALNDNNPEALERTLNQQLGNTLEAMGYGAPMVERPNKHLTYRPDILNANRDIIKLASGLKKHPHGRLCLYGPPGTGKTEFGRYLAQKLEKPLMVKRASDILDAYVGGTEKRIAQMFNQAQRDDAILLLDEADSFLQDRGGARYKWEITQVNELLTQMEEFNGLFICSTNLVDSLDAASIRRFDLKIKLDYLLPEQAWSLFQQVLNDQGVNFDYQSDWRSRLVQFNNLTPGDFATIIRQNRLSDEQFSPAMLLRELSAESAFKQQAKSNGIGFTAEI